MPIRVGADVAVAHRDVVRVADDGDAVGAVGGDGVVRDDVEGRLRPPMMMSCALPSTSTPLSTLPIGDVAVGVQADDVPGHADARGVAGDLDAVVAVVA